MFINQVSRVRSSRTVYPLASSKNAGWYLDFLKRIIVINYLWNCYLEWKFLRYVLNAELVTGLKRSRKLRSSVFRSWIFLLLCVVFNLWNLKRNRNVSLYISYRLSSEEEIRLPKNCVRPHHNVLLWIIRRSLELNDSISIVRSIQILIIIKLNSCVVTLFTWISFFKYKWSFDVLFSDYCGLNKAGALVEVVLTLNWAWTWCLQTLRSAHCNIDGKSTLSLNFINKWKDVKVFYKRQRGINFHLKVFRNADSRCC